MKHAIAVGVASITVIATSPIARAEPVAPQPDTPCPDAVAGALTQLPDLTTLLQCRAEPGVGNRWQILDDPYPHSDRWLTYGPTLTLHGEGQRNRELDSGDWVGDPQDPGARCTAQQQAIADAGGLTPPQLANGEPGRPLTLRLQPLLFTIELAGYCLWEKG